MFTTFLQNKLIFYEEEDFLAEQSFQRIHLELPRKLQ